MYTKGIPVVSAKVQNGYKIYNLAIGDTVTDMVVRWSYPERDETITGTVAGISLKMKGSPENDHAKVLDNIPMYKPELDDNALIMDSSTLYEVDCILFEVNESKYIKVPVSAIYSFTEEPDDVIKELVELKVVDGTDGFTPVEIPAVDQKIYANIVCSDKEIGVYPADESAHYKWSYVESPDMELGTEGAFTYTSDNKSSGKRLCVTVTVDDYSGQLYWEQPEVVNPVWPENSDVSIVV